MDIESGMRPAKHVVCYLRRNHLLLDKCLKEPPPEQFNNNSAVPSFYRLKLRAGKIAVVNEPISYDHVQMRVELQRV